MYFVDLSIVQIHILYEYVHPYYSGMDTVFCIGKIEMELNSIERDFVIRLVFYPLSCFPSLLLPFHIDNNQGKLVRAYSKNKSDYKSRTPTPPIPEDTNKTSHKVHRSIFIENYYFMGFD